MNVSIAAHSDEFNVYRVFAITFPVVFAQIIDGHVFATLLSMRELRLMPEGAGTNSTTKPVRLEIWFAVKISSRAVTNGYLSYHWPRSEPFFPSANSPQPAQYTR